MCIEAITLDVDVRRRAKSQCESLGKRASSPIWVSPREGTEIRLGGSVTVLYVGLLLIRKMPKKPRSYSKRSNETYNITNHIASINFINLS